MLPLFLHPKEANLGVSVSRVHPQLWFSVCFSLNAKTGIYHLQKTDSPMCDGTHFALGRPYKEAADTDSDSEDSGGCSAGNPLKSAPLNPVLNRIGASGFREYCLISPC